MTTTELMVPEAYTDDWVSLVKSRVAEGATDMELQLFLYQCKRTGLDPLARQIYFQKRHNKQRNKSEMTIVTGIDGYRLTAQRTGEYAGSDDPIFDSEENPKRATVTVYRMVSNTRCPFTASARWDQYYPGDAQGFMWRKMPHLMLGKCAEALALRKAFPQELSGIYVKEEMDQAGAPELAQPAPPPPIPPVPKAKREIYEIPFGSHGDQEVYVEHQEQLGMFVTSAKAAGVKDKALLKEISRHCNGTFVEDLELTIRKWLKEHDKVPITQENSP